VATPHRARPQLPEHLGRRRREQQAAAVGALGAATGALGDGGRDPAPELEDGFTRCIIAVRFLGPSRGRRAGLFYSSSDRGTPGARGVANLSARF
jgi:hypothetical protein